MMTIELDSGWEGWHPKPRRSGICPYRGYHIALMRLWMDVNKHSDRQSVHSWRQTALVRMFHYVVSRLCCQGRSPTMGAGDALSI